MGHQQAGPPWGVQQTYAPGPYGEPAAAEDRHRRDTFGLVTRVVLAVGAALCLGYAAWSVTARRGIFADFASGTIPTDSEISTSDTLDLIFILVAGAVALLGLGLWVARKSSGRTRGGGVELVGLVVAGLGLVTVLVALVLQDRSVADGTQTEQGDKAATASVVMGAGFTVVAIALLVGLMVNRRADRG